MCLYTLQLLMQMDKSILTQLLYYTYNLDIVQYDHTEIYL